MAQDILWQLAEIFLIYIPELLLVMLFSCKLLDTKINIRQILIISTIHGGITTPLIRHIGLFAAPLHSLVLLALLILTVLLVSRSKIIVSALAGVLTFIIIFFSEYIYFTVVVLLNHPVVNEALNGPPYMRIMLFIPLALFYAAINLVRYKFNLSISLRRGML